MHKLSDKTRQIFKGICSLIYIVPVGFLVQANIPYLRSTADEMIWFSLLPIFIVAIVYYLRSDTERWARVLSMKLGAFKGCLVVIAFALTFTYIIDRSLILAGFYLAKQPFVEIASVELAQCRGGRYKSFELTLLNNIHHRFKLYFPYDDEMCSDYAQLSHLKGSKIRLSGRQWLLGFAYDGFLYSKRNFYD